MKTRCRGTIAGQCWMRARRAAAAGVSSNNSATPGANQATSAGLTTTPREGPLAHSGRTVATAGRMNTNRGWGRMSHLPVSSRVHCFRVHSNSQNSIPCGTSWTIWSTTERHRDLKKPRLVLMLKDPPPQYRFPPCRALRSRDTNSRLPKRLHQATTTAAISSALCIQNTRLQTPACNSDALLQLIGALNAQIMCTLNST